jgi:hypothetical protein
METIYNLVPEVVVERPKPPMYRSMHDPKAPLAGSTFGIQGTTQLPGAGKAVKKDSSNFGPVDKSAPNPRDYLKGGTKGPRVPPRSQGGRGNFAYPDGRKPSVPSMEQKPVMGLRTTKNFITANAVEAILQVPQGITEMEADYLSKADYGKVPEYLSQVKEEIRRENEMIDAYVAEMGRIQDGDDDDSAQMELMSDQERAEVLASLKRKWDSVNAKYQKMTHLVKLDTTGKIQRKEALEKELNQLEADIEKLANRGRVFIST